MSEKTKHKDKDKDKKRKSSIEDLADVNVDGKLKKKKTKDHHREEEHHKDGNKSKDKKKDNKDKEKDKEKRKEKEKERDAEKDAADGTPVPEKPPLKPGSQRPAEPPEKKLKAWQDDMLEVDSGDEAKESTRGQTLSSIATQSTGQVSNEPDTLDAFMADLTKKVREPSQGAESSTGMPSEGMGVMEGMGVKTITLEEVEMLMGVTEETATAADERNTLASDPAAARVSPSPGVPSSTISASSSLAASSSTVLALDATAAPAASSTAPALDAGSNVGDQNEEEDDRFHTAFLAEIRRRRGEGPPPGVAVDIVGDFKKSDRFEGSKPGFVFKKGRLGLGYYRDSRGTGCASAPSASGADDAEKSGIVAEGAAEDDNQESEDSDTDDSDAAEQEENVEPKQKMETTSEEKKNVTDAVGIENEEAQEKETQKPNEGDAVISGEAQKAEEGDTVTSDQKPVTENGKIVTNDETDGKQESAVKKMETKQERKKRRKEERRAAQKAKAVAAKKKAKEGFGGIDDQRMESDPDRSEQSSEEEQESYFDLVKRFTTKKSLPAVDHSTIEYKPFRKNLYIQVKEITNMKEHEVDALRRTSGDIRVRGKHCPYPIKSFLQCGLPEKILKILDRRDYESPFPIQMQAIPALMCGRDVIGVAQTGSGKTLAYLLPMIRHMLDQPKIADGDGPIGFVVAPTRELALQIQRESNVFCKAVGMVSVCAFGGGPMGEQLSLLKKGAELLVGTPGRLIDVLTTSNGKITNLRRVTFLVLDEADRMFDMGFEPQIGMFLATTRPDKQVAMFSATLPTHVEALARKVLKKPLEINVGERNSAASNVTQFVEVLEESKKFYRLLQLLGEWHEHGSIIIFMHQQRDVDEMFTELLKYGYPTLALHGGQDQHDRDFTLQDFKDGVSNILIATSVAARGIDVKQVILVVNFKVPDHLEDYIHRIGRTGRAGKAGFAFTFIQPDEADRAQDLVDALRQCNQEVPQKLKQLAEEHQAQVNKGEVEKRRRWSGYHGHGFKFDRTEKSRQQKERSKAKKELLIGENLNEEVEEFKDPWLDDGAPGKPKDDKKQQNTAQSAPAASLSTVSNAAQIAASLRAANSAAEAATRTAAPLPAPAVAQAALPAAAANTGRPAFEAASRFAGSRPGMAFKLGPQGLGYYADPPSNAGPVPLASMAPPKAVPPRKVGTRPGRKSDEEIEEEARRKAEETLKNAPEEVREKQIAALTEKLKEKLRKAEEEQAAKAASAAPPPPPNPKEMSPLMKALPLVPGVIGGPIAMGGNSMVSRSIDELRANMAKGAGTAHLAQQAAALAASDNPLVPAGMFSEEMEINDYPQIARQRISSKDPLLQIEEMTGAKCQVRGQYFSERTKLPEGARRLYVEIIGPTTVSVQKAKQEVRRMMEALAIRTLNIPGMSQAVLGKPGRYDPMVGK